MIVLGVLLALWIVNDPQGAAGFVGNIKTWAFDAADKAIIFLSNVFN